MQDNTQAPEQADLLHNGKMASELREHIRTQARKLKLKDIQDILDKLRMAREQGEQELQAAQDKSEEELTALRSALEELQHAEQDAQRVFERKRHWELEVEPNIKLITDHAARASQLHRMLREKRRELRARDVELMSIELNTLEAEALSGWGVVRESKLAVPLEHRLHKATEAITNAKKDAEGTLQRKKPWEDAVAANIAAVEAELRKVSAQVVAHFGPLPSPGAAESEKAPAREDKGPAPDFTKAFRRVEELLRNRRPLDREALANLSGQLEALVLHTKGQTPAAATGATGAADAPKAAEPRRASREDIRIARAEVESVLGQAEASLGVTWVPRRPKSVEAPKAELPKLDNTAPAPASAAAPADETETEAQVLAAGLDAALEQAGAAAAADDQGHEHDEPEAHTEAPPSADETHDERSHLRAGDAEHGSYVTSDAASREPLKLGAIKNVQSLLNRAREILDTAIIPGSERKALWARFRNASDTLRRQRNVTRTLELESLRSKVREIVDGARQTNPAKTRKSIQDCQKLVLESPLSRAERDELLQALRSAWGNAGERQEELKEVRKQREATDLQKLGEHFMRWESRKEGIARLLGRLEIQLDEINERKKNTTSIGYKVLAEKRLQETRDRIGELKAVFEDLGKKILDVGPRLQAAGWVVPPPSERPQVDEHGNDRPRDRRDGDRRDGDRRDGDRRDGDRRDGDRRGGGGPDRRGGGGRPGGGGGRPPRRDGEGSSGG
ncbi:MAG: hypothetical protein ACKO6N_26300 [Myxococcota bacterium]